MFFLHVNMSRREKTFAVNAPLLYIHILNKQTNLPKLQYCGLLDEKYWLLPLPCSEYSQTSVFEHNPFQKAVRKAICSKTETIFYIRINVNSFNPFQV